MWKIPANYADLNNKNLSKKHRQKLIEIVMGCREDKSNIVKIPQGLAFQYSQTAFFVWLKFHLVFLSTLKGSCLCPEMFNRQQQHVRLQLVYWVCQCFHAGVFQKCSFSHCAVTESMGLMVATNIITVWKRSMHLKHLS